MDGSAPTIGIKFEHDAAHDLYVVYPCAHLRTPDDCAIWARIIDDFYAKVGRRTDSIVVLDMLTVEPAVVELYKKGREDVAARYLRHVVLVNCNPQLLLEKRNVKIRGANFAPDIVTAIGMIEAMRGSEVGREPDFALGNTADIGTQPVSHPVVSVVKTEHGRGR